MRGRGGSPARRMVSRIASGRPSGRGRCRSNAGARSCSVYTTGRGKGAPILFSSGAPPSTPVWVHELDVLRGRNQPRIHDLRLGVLLHQGPHLLLRHVQGADDLGIGSLEELGVLGDVVAEGVARHPQVGIELLLTDRPVELVEEKFDLGFRAGKLKDTSLVAHELGRAQPRCFATREYLRDRGTPRTPRDLLRHDCILFTPQAPRGRWMFRSRGKTLEVPVRGRLVVNSIPLARDAAMRGLGIVRLPRALLVEGLAAKQLVEVLDTYAPPPRPAYAVHPSGGRVTPAARVFLEIAKRHLERRVW